MSYRALALSLTLTLALPASFFRANSFPNPEPRAEVVFSDSLGYPDGSLVEANPSAWRHHSGAEFETQVVSGSIILTQSNTEDIHAPLGSEPFEPGSGATVFAGFELTPRNCSTGNPGYFLHFKDGGNGFRGRLFLEAMDGELDESAGEERCRLGISNGTNAPDVFVPDSIPLNEPVTVVLAYDTGSGNTRLWVDPEQEGSPSVVASDERTAIAVHSIALRQAARIGQVEVDNIRVAANFEGALEPATGHPFIVSVVAPAEIGTGQSISLSAAATGDMPLSFQWLFNGEPVDDAVSSTFTVEDFGDTNAGEYSVRVANRFGETESERVTIELDSTGSNHQTNLEISARVEIHDSERPGRFGEIDPALLDLSELSVRPGERISMAIEGAGAGDDAILSVSVEPEGMWDIEPSTPGRARARFEWAPTTADADGSLRVALTLSHESETASREWTIHVPTMTDRALAITEVLAAPTSDPAAAHFNPLNRIAPVDPDRVGVADEFVELVNLGDRPLDLGGWTLGDAAAIRHRFADGTVVPPGGALIVHGAEVAGAEPDLPADVQVQAASVSSFIGLGLNNGGDVVRIRNADGRVVTQFAYQPGESWSGSMTRQAPSITGAWIPHPPLNGLTVSPGRGPGGEPFTPANSAPRPVLRVIRVAGSPAVIRLQWTADPSKSYSVHRATSLAGAFEEVAGALQFGGGGDGGDGGTWETPVDSNGNGFFFRIAVE